MEIKKDWPLFYEDGYTSEEGSEKSLLYWCGGDAFVLVDKTTEKADEVVTVYHSRHAIMIAWLCRSVYYAVCRE